MQGVYRPTKGPHKVRKKKKNAGAQGTMKRGPRSHPQPANPNSGRFLNLQHHCATLTLSSCAYAAVAAASQRESNHLCDGRVSCNGRSTAQGLTLGGQTLLYTGAPSTEPGKAASLDCREILDTTFRLSTGALLLPLSPPQLPLKAALMGPIFVRGPPDSCAGSGRPRRLRRYCNDRIHRRPRGAPLRACTKSTARQASLATYLGPTRPFRRKGASPLLPRHAATLIPHHPHAEHPRTPVFLDREPHRAWYACRPRLCAGAVGL